VATASTPLYLIPGAADDPAIDGELSAAGGNPVNVDGRCLELPGGLLLVADSCRPGSKSALYERLGVAAGRRPTVLMTAAPPHDGATEAGSTEVTEVTEAIERLRPGLSVHGLSGVTGEMPDPKRWIGDTLALTPGSQAEHGGLAGFVVDLVGGGVRVARPFRT
jgi:hypothetical protein